MATSISLSDLNSLTPTEIDNKNKLKVTGIGQVPTVKNKVGPFPDTPVGQSISLESSPVASDPTVNITPAQPDLSTDAIKGHLKDLYANAFGRDPEYNDDMSDTADYWIGAVQRGDQGDRDWTKWLDDSIYGSQEFKTQGPGLTPHDKDWVESLNRSGGGGSSGPSMEEIRSMVEGMFSRIDTPWTPYGYGWGGTNSNAVRINRSQGSRRGTSYAGNRSSFNRSGSRLNSGTPWMNTLGM